MSPKMFICDNFVDQYQICGVLFVICQPGLKKTDIKKIRDFRIRNTTRRFDIDATKTNRIKYIFNLKTQMNFGRVNLENYSDEDRIQNFLLSNSIDDINDSVRFIGYDS